MFYTFNPDFSGFIPTVLLVVLGMGFTIIWLVHEFIILPPVARRFRKAKWKKCSPAFVQDNFGRVHFVINDEELPEGVVHNKRGWFLTSRSPYISEEEEQTDKKTKKRGPKTKEERDKEQHEKDQMTALHTILEVPVLEGFGKGVFFGYDGSPLLSNLKTLVHADLRVMKEVIPATISRTQIDALNKWSVLKGYMKRGGEIMKLILIVVCVIGVVATVGIIAYLLMYGGG